MWPLFGRSRIMDRDERLPILREGEVIYVDGKPVKRDPIRFEAPANVQPLTGKQLLLVPEGDRLKEQFMLYAPLASGVMRLRLADKVWRNGAVFILHECKDWGSYTEARMVRQDVPGGLPDFGTIPTGDGACNPGVPPESPVMQ
jgi:hypothetical protein